MNVEKGHLEEIIPDIQKAHVISVLCTTIYQYYYRIQLYNVVFAGS